MVNYEDYTETHGQQNIKKIDALISQIHFWNKTLHVSESSSLYHQEIFHCAHSNFVCHTRLLTVCSANLCDIYHCCVHSEKTRNDGQRNCPKHVELYSKNEFEKLVHLVDFIIRILHKQLYERNKNNSLQYTT